MAPAAQRHHAGRPKHEREHPGGTDAGVVELEAIGRIRADRGRRRCDTLTAFEPSRLITKLGILITGLLLRGIGSLPRSYCGRGA